MAWVIKEGHRRRANNIWYFYHRSVTDIPLFAVLDGEERPDFTRWHFAMRTEYNALKKNGKEAVKKLLRDMIRTVYGWRIIVDRDKIENYTYKEWCSWV